MAFASAVLVAGLLVSPAASDPPPPAPPTLTSSPPDPTNVTDASFDFTGEGGVTFDCSLDGADFASCTSPQSYFTLVEGAHSFAVRALSPGGTSEPTSYSWYVDLTPPALPGDQSAEATSAAGAVVAFAATDDHELAGFSCEPASGTTFALGTTTVACTAEDSAGNSVAGDFDASVVDTRPPVLDLPADITVEATGPQGAVVGYTPAASDLVDGPVEPECVPAPGSTFPLGSTTVSCTATDAHANTSDANTFAVTVEDTTAPALDLPADITAEAIGPGGAIVDYAASASDLVDGDVEPDCVPAPGSAFALGTTTVSCTATDAGGNTSDAGTFAVTVEDTTAPTFDPHADQFAAQDYADGGHVSYSPPVTAHDAVDAAPDVVCDPESGSAFPFGSTLVTCTATDDAGNTSDPLLFTVTVESGPVPDAPVIDVKPPLLTRSTLAHFEFSTSGTLISVRCQLDDKPFEDCADSQDYPDLAERPHQFTVRVTNEIGNQNQASYSWTVDLTSTGPVINLRAHAAPGSVTLRWGLPLDADFDRVRIQRRREGAATWRTVARRATSPYKDTGLANEVKYRYRTVSIDIAGNLSDPATTTARPSKVFAPQYGATDSPPVVVDWTSVRDASYYNMQVWRGGRKILSVWPSGSRYRIPSRWTFRGRRYVIDNRRHVVYVWPGFGPKAAARFGRLLGSTSFFGP